MRFRFHSYFKSNYERVDTHPASHIDELLHCGGVGGYEHLLEVIADQAHEEYAEMMGWLGGRFDSEQFDVWKTDTALRSSHRNWEWRRA